MRSWFESLAERERIFVLAAGATLLLATFWFGIWTPLDSGQESAAARVDTWKISLAELRPLKGQVQSSASGQPLQAEHSRMGRSSRLSACLEEFFYVPWLDRLVVFRPCQHHKILGGRSTLVVAVGRLKCVPQGVPATADRLITELFPAPTKVQHSD